MEPARHPFSVRDGPSVRWGCSHRKSSKVRMEQKHHLCTKHCLDQYLYWYFSCFLEDECCCSVTKSCPTLCKPMDCITRGFSVHHHLPELALTHVHRVGDAIQPSHPLPLPFPPALNLSQHQGLFQWVRSSYQMATVLEFQLQHQSFQWIVRIDCL